MKMEDDLPAKTKTEPGLTPFGSESDDLTAVMKITGRGRAGDQTGVR
jgi:hypothetical protein